MSVVRDVTITHVGGPTVLIEVLGWRILTDPTFDPPGGRYGFGLGTSSVKTTAPALAAADLGPIDAVLLSHDQHADNLDGAGRELLPAAGTVITTLDGARRLNGAKRLGGNAVGLAPGQSHELAAPGRPTIAVTATPARHGPPLLTAILVGQATGFDLAWEAQEAGTLWVSGDTVLYPALLDWARTATVDTAVVHLGSVQFPQSGPLRYTMTGADAVKLAGVLGPRQVIPVHFEGWKHFRQGRAGIERDLAAAPAPIRDLFHFLVLPD